MEQQLNEMLWPSNNNHYIVSDRVTEVVEMTCGMDLLNNTDRGSVYYIGVRIMNISYYGHVYLVPDISDEELKPMLQKHMVERPCFYAYLILTAESYEKTGKAGVLSRLKLCESIKAICNLEYIVNLIT